MPPRQTSLAKFREELTRTYGDRVAPRREGPARYDVLSSGSLTLDWALRKGGLLRGRIHEIAGPPDAAKTTLVTCALAGAQRAYPDLGLGYVDIEGTFDDDWAAANGLDTNGIEHVYADDSEDCSDQSLKLVKSGLYSLVVVDSIGGMQSRKTLAKGAADPLPFRNSQIITQMCQALASAARQANCTVILVNQLRAPVGTMSKQDKSAGPKAMQHATTTRITMAKGSTEPVKMTVEEGQDPQDVTRQFKARVTRIKVGAPGRVAEFWVNVLPTKEYGPLGINVIDEYLSLGVRLDVIERDGAGNYTLPGCKKVKGRVAAAQLLRDRPELCAAVRERIFSPGGQP